jgi:hypothetical protein
MPLAPPPQRRRGSSSRSIFANALPSRTTTPGTPPSRTIRLEPSPERHHRHVRDRARAGSHQVVLVGRLEQPFRIAAALEPDERRERRVGGELAAHLGHGRARAHFFALALAMPSARPAAHLVMSPAPMQMIMSPSAARSRSCAAEVVGSVDRLTMRWPRAQALDQRLGIDALDRLLAGRIDRRDEHHVGVVEGVLEVVHQRLQPGVAVRLDDRDHPPSAPSRAADSTARISTGWWA